jgi:hypothetical protein
MNKFDSENYWEIGKAYYSFNKIIDNIQRVGFKIEKTYRVFENIYNRLKDKKEL